MNNFNKHYLLQTPSDKRYNYLLISFLFLSFLLIPNTAFCTIESNYPVTVFDGTTNERLVGVSVFTNENKFIGSTDENGKVTISQMGHRDEINFSYVGYNDVRLPMYQIRKQNGIIQMFADNILEGVVVIGRTDAGAEELPYVIDRITAEDIASRNSQTTADVLGEHADVYIQKSQMGGGSPIIRGFEANKVLLVLDGIRLNNAIYRNGHLQNAITIDGSMLEQVEVIYGPGSLMYGSEALGGVIHFRSRDPKVVFNSNDKNTDTRAYTRFSSANLEKTVHFDFEYGSKKWASLTGMSYSDFGELTAGSKRPDAYPNFGKRDFFMTRNGADMIIQSPDSDVQNGTAYSQIDFLQKVRYQPKETLYFIANFQYSSSSNIPRYDALLDTLKSADRLKWAEWYYGPQKRMLASLKMKAFAPKMLYDKATFIGAFQLLEEDRLKRRFRRDHRTFNLEDVFVYSFTADFDKHFGKNNNSTISYGLDGNFNQVFSEAGQINVETGEVIREEFTRYPSDYSTMLSYAGYMNYRWKGFDSLLVFNAGLRYSTTDLFVKYKSSDLKLIDWPEEYITTGVSSSSSALTWGAGLTLNTRDNWQLHVLASSAFRSPNIDDFAKSRVQNGQIVIPNTTLGPETSMSGEATIAKTVGNKQATSLKLSATGFYTILENVIVRQAGYAPNGDSCIVIFSEGGDCYDVQQNFNADNGTIYGASANVLLKIGKHWKLKSGLSYTKGLVKYKSEVIDTLVPMAHIPPVYGQTSLSYQTKKLRFEVVAKYNNKKAIDEYAVNKISVNEGVTTVDLEGTPDNPELGIAYTDGNQVIYEGTYGWTTYNFYSSFNFNSKVSLELALENITDRHYRLFASGVSAPGRNFILTLRGKF